jgi:hypothetical protein
MNIFSIQEYQEEEEEQNIDFENNNFFENDKIFNISHELLLKKQRNRELYLNKKKLMESVKKLSKDEIIEIFKIFLDNNVPYSENNNGIFINLNNVKEKTLSEINKYIEYIEVKKNDLIDSEIKVNEQKELLGETNKIVVDNFEVNKTIYKEYEFQENHEEIFNNKINECLKNISSNEVDQSKISLKRKKNKYHGNMAKLINSFKEPKEKNPNKQNKHKSYSEEK